MAVKTSLNRKIVKFQLKKISSIIFYMNRYNFKTVEAKWQKIWQEQKYFVTKIDKTKKKFYCLEMYPYPSGNIHMGHVRNYAIGDVLARFKSMQGFNV